MYGIFPIFWQSVYMIHEYFKQHLTFKFIYIFQMDSLCFAANFIYASFLYLKWHQLFDRKAIGLWKRRWINNNMYYPLFPEISMLPVTLGHIMYLLSIWKVLEIFECFMYCIFRHITCTYDLRRYYVIYRYFQYMHTPFYKWNFLRHVAKIQ